MCRRRPRVLGFLSHVDQNRRLEGASDPTDMVIVLSFHCPICDRAGTLVLHYGPDAGEEEVDALEAFTPRVIEWSWSVTKVRGRTKLAAVAVAAADCTNCDLYRNATQTVFGTGPVGATLMLVGEQPGDKEDIAGEPFVGPAGAILPGERSAMPGSMTSPST